jgi:hypothetical protein
MAKPRVNRQPLRQTNKSCGLPRKIAGPNMKQIERIVQSRFCLAGLLVFIVLAFYLRVVGFDYVWDDTDIFLGRIDTLMRMEFSLSELGKPFLGSLEYFRPLTVLTYYLDVSIAGFDPGFSHAVNLAIFILNVVLVFSVCRLLAEGTGHRAPVLAAFLAALIYALHPAMIEATAWISGRFDLLVTFFILAATRIYLSKTKPLLKIVLVSGMTLLSLLCKETGVVFPLTILCLWIATHPHEQGNAPFPGKALRENAGFLLAFCLVFALYLVMRLNVEGNAYLRTMAQIDLAYLVEKGFLALESIKLYLVLSFLPFLSVSAQHPMDHAFSAWSARDVLGNLLTLAILGGVFYLAIRKRSPAAWIFIAGLTYLFLVLHVIPLRMNRNLASDRFLSAPLAFWVMAVVLVRDERILSSPFLQRMFSSMRLFSPRGLLLGTMTCWILFSGLTTYTTIPLWKNSLSLWSWTYSLYPGDWFTRSKYTLALLSSGRPDLLKREIQAMKQDLKEEKGLATRLLYSNLLLADRDPDVLPLLQNMIAENPEFRGENAQDPSGTQRTVAYLYSLYAEATLLFERDLEKSAQYAEKAGKLAEQAYEEKQAKAWIGFRKIAILYASGKFTEGDALRAEIIAFSGKPEALDASVSSILQYYCQEETPICATLRSRTPAIP